MFKMLLCISFICCSIVASAQTDTIRLHFLYGSKPAKGYKKTESKHFGGIKGGHVNIEAGGRVLDFMPGKCPILPENKKPSGGFRLNRSIYWDTATTKWATVLIPVSRKQMAKLDSLFDLYSQTTPYDYAVFGMRCAAASYDVLSEIGLFPEMSNRTNVVRHFYPKLLRKRIYKWAEKNNYTIVHHGGRETRKWESDSGLF